MLNCDKMAKDAPFLDLAAATRTLVSKTTLIYSSFDVDTLRFLSRSATAKDSTQAMRRGPGD